MTDRRWTMISMMLNAFSAQGHVYSYHLAVREAVERLGGTHVGLLPRTSTVTALPPQWRKMLPGTKPPCGEPGWRKLVRKIREGVALARAVRRYVRAGAGPRPIVFLETFTVSQLLAVVWALRARGERYPLWLLFRYAPAQQPRRAALFRLMLALCARTRSLPDVTLLTDSHLLAAELQPYFDRSCRVLPIPHIFVPDPADTEPHDDVRCWWPGEPRPEKGLDLIRQLPRLRAPAGPRLTLIVGAAAQCVATADGCRVEALADHLSTADYRQCMARADILLLPYEASVYRWGTSGIFVEAVAAGKLPLVSAGTWMAAELRRFTLDELVVVTAQPEAWIARMQAVVADATIRERLQRMQQVYLREHGVEAFARALPIS